MNKVYADFIQLQAREGLKDAYVIEDAFDANQLASLNQYFEELTFKQGGTRNDAGGPATLGSYRSSRICWLPKDEKYHWFYTRMGELVKQANAEYWQFDLFGLREDAQLTEYHANEAGHYDWHTDFGNVKVLASRKLSISVQISDGDAYTGGELEYLTRRQPNVASRKAGAVVIFPSYLLHRVKPVTSGIRRSIVQWVAGPPFR